MKSANTHFPSLSQEGEAGRSTAKEEIAFDVNSMSLFIESYSTRPWNLTRTDVARHKSVSVAQTKHRWLMWSEGADYLEYKQKNSNHCEGFRKNHFH